jgi:4-hydroxy-tetrahydrodipicolinate synthase
MTETANFSGVIAPVLTPFGEDGAPDPDRFIEHAEWLMGDGGCTALAPFGTTSEANSLALDERMDLLEELVESGLEPLNLMPGTGTCSLADTITLTQHAIDLGVGGVLMLPPFYYKDVSDEGLYKYYAEVIDEIADDNLRIYLYHIPQVSGVRISLDLIERLRGEFPETVLGLKDSSGDWSNMHAILERFPGLKSFSGTSCASAAPARSHPPPTSTARACDSFSRIGRTRMPPISRPTLPPCARRSRTSRPSRS